MKRTRRLHRIIIPLLLLAVAMPLRAQSDAALTQYFNAPTYYNPAAVGETDFLRIRGGSRLQWVGIDGAPQTFIVTADSPFKLFNKKVAAGVVLQQESIGLFSGIAAGAQLAYKQKIGKGILTGAVQIGFLNQKFKGTEVEIPDDDDFHESTDEAIPTNDIAGTSVDFGAGLWYTHRLFYAGVSCTHINSPAVNMTMEGSETTEDRKYEFKFGRTLYFIAGSNIPVKNTLFEVMPSVMVKSDLTFTQVDVTLRARYNRFLTFGAAYRSEDAVSVILGVDFKGFFLGYSYDYPLSAISRASSGSHEIMAGYNLKLDFSEKNRNRHKSIRIM